MLRVKHRPEISFNPPCALRRRPLCSTSTVCISVSVSCARTGTGKTLIAKAIAGEAGVPFYQMTGSEFVEIIVGVGAARVRDLFKRARVNAPCIIFVDEIDALGIRRADAGALAPCIICTRRLFIRVLLHAHSCATGIRTNEEREQTLNQLLTEIDGFEVDLGNPVVFMAATNRADLLDPALLRAGRFDRKIRVQRPDTEGRFSILKVHARSRAKHMDLNDDDLMQLAKDLPGLSGAELENIINEAALEGIRRGTMRIGKEEAYAAVDRVLQGLRRPPLSSVYEVTKRVAAYEAGRGLVAQVLGSQSGQLEKVERVSIERRGEYVGAPQHWSCIELGLSCRHIRLLLAHAVLVDFCHQDCTQWMPHDVSTLSTGSCPVPRLCDQTPTSRSTPKGE